MNECLSDLIRKCYIYRYSSRVQPSDSWDNIDVISHHQTTHILPVTLQRRTSLMQSKNSSSASPRTPTKKLMYRATFLLSRQPPPPLSFLAWRLSCERDGMELDGAECYARILSCMSGANARCIIIIALHCPLPPPCENTERWLGRDGELEWNG